MCDMREVGAEQGREEGILIGREQGIIEGKIRFVHNLLSLKYSFSEALKIAEIDEKTYNTYKDKYGKDNLT